MEGIERVLPFRLISGTQGRAVDQREVSEPKDCDKFLRCELKIWTVSEDISFLTPKNESMEVL